MRWLWLAMALGGCAATGAGLDPAVCGSPVETLARDHARALAEDASDRAVVTGRRLLGALKAGCGWE